MIYSLKYKGRPDIGVALGRLAAGEFMAAGFFDGVDVIVPVPLARKRLRERGYNQSAEVAAGVSSLTGIPVDARSVCRKAFKTSQTKLGRWERLGNVSGLFEVRRQERLLGSTCCWSTMCSPQGQPSWPAPRQLPQCRAQLSAS